MGSPLSFKSLAEDLQVDFNTCKRWIEILDTLYYSFLISPFGSPKIRAVKKEQKLYLWDFSQVEDLGCRFENMVACQLLKHCHYMEDVEGHKMELRYIRDTDKREVDFVVIQNKKPKFAVECKLSDTNLTPSIPYFVERTPVPRFYQVHMGNVQKQVSDKVTILPFDEFCKLESME
ncbi:DUF4143 domain-containing protein [Leptospira sp. 96542]|nr:DUF4143 domain-containing protein [Leptospira sp. 96542]